MKYMTVRGALAAQYPQLICHTALGFKVCTAGGSLGRWDGWRGGAASHVRLVPARS